MDVPSRQFRVHLLGCLLGLEEERQQFISKCLPRLRLIADQRNLVLTLTDVRHIVPADFFTSLEGGYAKKDVSLPPSFYASLFKESMKSALSASFHATLIARRYGEVVKGNGECEEAFYTALSALPTVLREDYADKSFLDIEFSTIYLERGRLFASSRLKRDKYTPEVHTPTPTKPSICGVYFRSFEYDDKARRRSLTENGRRRYRSENPHLEARLMDMQARAELVARAAQHIAQTEHHSKVERYLYHEYEDPSSGVEALFKDIANALTNTSPRSQLEVADLTAAQLFHAGNGGGTFVEYFGSAAHRAEIESAFVASCSRRAAEGDRRSHFLATSLLSLLRSVSDVDLIRELEDVVEVQLGEEGGKAMTCLADPLALNAVVSALEEVQEEVTPTARWERAQSIAMPGGCTCRASTVISLFSMVEEVIAKHDTAEMCDQVVLLTGAPGCGMTTDMMVMKGFWRCFMAWWCKMAGTEQMGPPSGSESEFVQTSAQVCGVDSVFCFSSFADVHRIPTLSIEKVCFDLISAIHARCRLLSVEPPSLSYPSCASAAGVETLSTRLEAALFCLSVALKGKTPVGRPAALIILDGVSEWSGFSTFGLSWLPQKVPTNVRVVVTCSDVQAKLFPASMCTSVRTTSSVDAEEVVQGRIHRILEEARRKCDSNTASAFALEASTPACYLLANRLEKLHLSKVESIGLNSSVRLNLREILTITFINHASMMCGKKLNWAMLETLVFLCTVGFGTIDDLLGYLLFQYASGNTAAVVATTDPRFCSLKGETRRVRPSTGGQNRSNASNRGYSAGRRAASASFKSRSSIIRRPHHTSASPPRATSPSPSQLLIVEDEEDSGSEGEHLLSSSVVGMESSSRMSPTSVDQLPALSQSFAGVSVSGAGRREASGGEVTSKERDEWRVRTALLAMIQAGKGVLYAEQGGVFFISSTVVLDAAEKMILYSGRAKAEARSRVLDYITWKGRDDPLFVQHAISLQAGKKDWQGVSATLAMDIFGVMMGKGGEELDTTRLPYPSPQLSSHLINSLQSAPSIRHVRVLKMDRLGMNEVYVRGLVQTLIGAKDAPDSSKRQPSTGLRPPNPLPLSHLHSASPPPPNGLSRMLQIEVLSLRNNVLGPGAGLYLRDYVRGNPFLKELDVAHNAIRDEGVRLIFDGLRHNDVLDTLCVAKNEVGKGGFEAIETFLDEQRRSGPRQRKAKNIVCSSLRSLDVSGAAVDLASARALARSMFKCLKAGSARDIVVSPRKRRAAAAGSASTSPKQGVNGGKGSVLGGIMKKGGSGSGGGSGGSVQQGAYEKYKGIQVVSDIHLLGLSTRMFEKEVVVETMEKRACPDVLTVYTMLSRVGATSSTLRDARRRLTSTSAVAPFVLHSYLLKGKMQECLGQLHADKVVLSVMSSMLYDGFDPISARYSGLEKDKVALTDECIKLLGSDREIKVRKKLRHLVWRYTAFVMTKRGCMTRWHRIQRELLHARDMQWHIEACTLRLKTVVSELHSARTMAEFFEWFLSAHAAALGVKDALSSLLCVLFEGCNEATSGSSVSEEAERAGDRHHFFKRERSDLYLRHAQSRVERYVADQLSSLKMRSRLLALDIRSKGLGMLESIIVSGLLPSASHLFEIDVSDNVLKHEGSFAFFDTLAKAPLRNMRRLNLNANMIMTDYNKDGVNPMEPLSYLLSKNAPFQLEELYLARNGICDEHLKLLLDEVASSEHLLLLDLSDNFIKFKGAAAIASAIASNEHLRVLRLSGNYLQRLGVEAVVNSLCRQSDGTPRTDSGLREVDLRNNNNVFDPLSYDSVLSDIRLGLKSDSLPPVKVDGVDLSFVHSLREQRYREWVRRQKHALDFSLPTADDILEEREEKTGATLTPREDIGQGGGDEVSTKLDIALPSEGVSNLDVGLISLALDAIFEGPPLSSRSPEYDWTKGMQSARLALLQSWLFEPGTKPAPGPESSLSPPNTSPVESALEEQVELEHASTARQSLLRSNSHRPSSAASTSRPSGTGTERSSHRDAASRRSVVDQFEQIDSTIILKDNPLNEDGLLLLVNVIVRRIDMMKLRLVDVRGCTIAPRFLALFADTFLTIAYAFNEDDEDEDESDEGDGSEREERRIAEGSSADRKEESERLEEWQGKGPSRSSESTGRSRRKKKGRRTRDSVFFDVSDSMLPLYTSEYQRGELLFGSNFAFLSDGFDVIDDTLLARALNGPLMNIADVIDLSRTSLSEDGQMEVANILRRHRECKYSCGYGRMPQASIEQPRSAFIAETPFLGRPQAFETKSKAYCFPGCSLEKPDACVLPSRRGGKNEPSRIVLRIADTLHPQLAQEIDQYDCVEDVVLVQDFRVPLVGAQWSALLPSPPEVPKFKSLELTSKELVGNPEATSRSLSSECFEQMMFYRKRVVEGSGDGQGIGEGGRHRSEEQFNGEQF